MLKFVIQIVVYPAAAFALGMLFHWPTEKSSLLAGVLFGWVSVKFIFINWIIWRNAKLAESRREQIKKSKIKKRKKYEYK
jgi:hypothetical protein